MTLKYNREKDDSEHESTVSMFAGNEINDYSFFHVVISLGWDCYY